MEDVSTVAASPVAESPTAPKTTLKKNGEWGRLPLVLFLATWLSVLLSQLMTDPGAVAFGRSAWAAMTGHGVSGGVGFAGIPRTMWNVFRFSFGMAICYTVPLMTILICHEAGHWLQARAYRVRASWPLFIPMPLSIIGTMGAVIRMDPVIPNRRALFDIGISGPLAGLVPTLIFCWVGLVYSYVAPVSAMSGTIRFGEPLIFQWMVQWRFGTLAPGMDVVIHPIAFAGWTGLLLTSVNLFPISQLDGGHVLYAIIPQYAKRVAAAIHAMAVVAVLVGGIWFHQTELYAWLLMLGLLAWMGTGHPPTCDDVLPIGRWRAALGWATLALLLIGFTPVPIR